MKQNRVHVASIVFLVLAIGLTPAALAAKGGGGKGRNCTRNAPGVSIDNTLGVVSTWLVGAARSAAEIRAASQE
jgi:hypothetical protein